MTKALVVFSGGQDSTTCLGIARAAGFEVEAIGFNYGQRHQIELNQAHRIADALRIPFTIVDVREFGKLVASATALVGSGEVGAQSPIMGEGIPASFVPNRNAMFLTIAHGYAQVIGADVIYTGVCETDYSGYPDCREVFIKRLEMALNVGYETHIKILTPLMHITKGETFKLAEETGILDLIVHHSHTCYEGKRASEPFVSTGDGKIKRHEHFHEWGHGCGECPACKLRAKGWEDYQAMHDIAHSGAE